MRSLRNLWLVLVVCFVAPFVGLSTAGAQVPAYELRLAEARGALKRACEKYDRDSAALTEIQENLVSARSQIVAIRAKINETEMSHYEGLVALGQRSDLSGSEILEHRQSLNFFFGTVMSSLRDELAYSVSWEQSTLRRIYDESARRHEKARLAKQKALDLLNDIEKRRKPPHTSVRAPTPPLTPQEEAKLNELVDRLLDEIDDMLAAQVPGSPDYVDPDDLDRIASGLKNDLERGNRAIQAADEFIQHDPANPPPGGGNFDSTAATGTDEEAEVGEREPFKRPRPDPQGTRFPEEENEYDPFERAEPNPAVTVEFDVNRFNLPNSYFSTVNATTGDPNMVPLGPSSVTGFGGRVGVIIPPFWSDGAPQPSLPVIETQPNDVSAFMQTDVVSITDGQLLYVGYNHYSGDATSQYVQPAGVQQVVTSVGGTGTPFGLNDLTTFNTEIESNGVEFGTRLTTNLLSGEHAGVGAFFGLHGEYNRRTLDVDYNTTDGTMSYNSYLDIVEKTGVIRPTFGLSGSYSPDWADHFEFGARFEIGPSVYFNRVNYSDCGSTDPTGGACNGGFFRSSASDSSVDWELFAMLTAFAIVNINDNSAFKLFGSVQTEHVNGFQVPNTIPGSPAGTWNGKPLYYGKTTASYSGGISWIHEF